MPYLALKHLHITFVTLSVSLFLLRGFWMWTQSPKLQQRWVKIAPHIIDTLLFASGITAVSYTHLDVYKRQGLHRVCCPC